MLVGNDPLHDILPAKAIGMKTVLLAPGPIPPDPEADAQISDLSQLRGFLALET